MKQRQQWSARSQLVLGFLGLAVLLGGFGSWAVGSSIAGAVIATGRIEVDRNRQIVQHLDGGIVAEILVDEGDTVEQGQMLIRLDAADLQSRLAVVEGQLFEVMARRGRLEAERDGAGEIIFDPQLLDLVDVKPDVADFIAGQQRLFMARRESVAREIEQMQKRKVQIEEQIVGVQAQQRSTRIQLDLIAEERETQQSLLTRGLTQAGTVLTLRRTEADLEGSLGSLISSEAQARGRITELDIEVLRLSTEQREEAISRLRDLRFQEVELAENRRNLQQQLARLDVSAPVSGVVYGMQVQTPRSVIRAAEPVLYLVPQDRPLVIATEVAPTDIDQIYVGQTVTLRFSALDQRQTPELFGTVSQVSADAFEQEGTQLTYYRAEVELNPGELERLPDEVALIPGMPVESYIRTEERSPLTYLIKPLSDYFVRAFRET